MVTKKMEEKIVYGRNQKAAFKSFRASTPDKYIPINAKYAGTKHGYKVYLVKYRLRKSEY